MNSPVITANPDATVKEVVDLIVKNNIGSVVIVSDDDTPVGIVTKHDIIYKVLARGKEPAKVTAKEVMSKPLITIDAEARIPDALRVMRQNRVERLGVTAKGKLVGMVSASDILSFAPEILDMLTDRVMILETAPTPVRTASFLGYCDECGQWSDLLKEVDGHYLCPDCVADLEASE